MFRIKTLNKISPAGLSVLDKSRFTVSDDAENEDGILVRSADMQDYPCLLYTSPSPRDSH